MRFQRLGVVAVSVFYCLCASTAYATGETLTAKVDNTLTAITTDKPSAYEQKNAEEAELLNNPLGIVLYKPTYILPAYYTQSPDYAIYQNNTPDSQKVQQMELKAQFSFLLPLVTDLFNYPNTDLDVAYTQLSYWQVYAASQYFRETDYEPEIFVSWHPKVNWFAHFGVVHQSNGLGGEYERSWNRAYTDLIFARGNWDFSVEPWVLIFTSESSDLHNPDIPHYLGNGEFNVAYKLGKNEFSVMSRNNLESGFSRGAEEIDYSHYLYKHFNVYLQFFSGYGQSLIEYNHYTNAVGVGISLNNWL